MSPVAATFAVLLWAVAAYAAVRVAMAWIGLMAMAPARERVPAAFEIGFWNFAAAERRLGPGAQPLIRRYRRGFYLFFACLFSFFALTVASIFLSKSPNP